MILCIGTTPAVQRVMVFKKLTIDAVNRATVTLDGIAGKSVNVAKVLRALGEQPLATGFLGGDRGDFIRSILSEKGVQHEFVTTQTRTRQCVTLIDEIADTHTELVEESRPVSAEDYGKLMEIVQRRINLCRAVIMSGTITPGGPVDLYQQCIRLIYKTGVLSVADAQGGALIEVLKSKPGVVKPNRNELAATVGRPLKDETDVWQAMRELHERGARRVVITAGRDATLAFDGCTGWRISTPAIQTKNPIGSGDAFTAGLVWSLLRGDDLGEACRWAVATGAANALTLMAGEVERKDVELLAARVRMTLA